MVKLPLGALSEESNLETKIDIFRDAQVTAEHEFELLAIQWDVFAAKAGRM